MCLIVSFCHIYLLQQAPLQLSNAVVVCLHQLQQLHLQLLCCESNVGHQHSQVSCLIHPADSSTTAAACCCSCLLAAAAFPINCQKVFQTAQPLSRLQRLHSCCCCCCGSRLLLLLLVLLLLCCCLLCHQLHKVLRLSVLIQAQVSQGYVVHVVTQGASHGRTSMDPVGGGGRGERDRAGAGFC